MKYTRLGTSGMTVSRLCLGMMTYGSKTWREWILDEAAARPLVKSAVDAGITFFDTADVYSLGESERITGKLLGEFFARREDYVLATKVFSKMGDKPNEQGLSRKHIMASIDASLKRLGVDYVDLYQIHRFDSATPIEETLDALNDVVRAGKALYLGASSMYSWQFLRMLQYQREHGLARFVSMQNHYNLVYREEEREMNPLCRAEGIGLIPWSPLARGLLARDHTGAEARERSAGQTTRAKTDDFATAMYTRESDFTVVDRVGAVAKARGAKNAQVALAWLLGKREVSAPIIGVSKPGHLEDAIGAMDLELTADEVKQVEGPYEPHPVLGHSY